jgi:hypothetical protein
MKDNPKSQENKMYIIIHTPEGDKRITWTFEEIAEVLADEEEIDAGNFRPARAFFNEPRARHGDSHVQAKTSKAPLV